MEKYPVDIFKQIVETNWDSIVFADLEGNVAYSNAAANKLYGYDDNELYGKSVAIFNANITISTEDILKTLLDTGGWSGELLQKRKDESTFFAALTLRLVHDEEGNPAGYASHSKDISVEVDNKNTLFDTQNQLYATLNNSNEFICSIDLDYNFINFNHRMSEANEQMGNGPLEKGTSALTMIAPEKHESILRNYKKVISSKEMLTLVDKYPSVFGGFRYVETSHNPIMTDGVVTGISLFSKDVTENVLYEEELKRNLEEKEVLLAEVHHRVKNNLAIISSILQLQQMNTESKETAAALMESQYRIKTTALIHEMLYENESLVDLDLKTYLEKLIQNIFSAYTNEGDGFGFKLNVEDVKLGISHSISVGLIVNEIITNAFKHGFEDKSHGNIHIDFMTVNGDAILHVINDGKPLDKDFELSNVMSTGMSLVKTFTRQLRGDIEVEKEPFTKFKITFPIGV